LLELPSLQFAYVGTLEWSENCQCTPFNRGLLDNVCSDGTEYGSHYASCTFYNAPLPIVKETPTGR
jgi:hypothetical protein